MKPDLGLRTLARAAHLGITLAWIVATTAVCRARIRIRPGLRGRLARAEALRLTRQLERVGGLWVKIGQYLSCRRDFLPGDLCDALTRLQGRVRPMASRRSRHLVARIMAEQPGLDVLPAPFAAGCVAQIHAANSGGGRKLVLKIRRPNATSRIIVDLALLRLLSRILARWRRFADLPVVRVAEELHALMLSQTDLGREAESISAMAPSLRQWGIACPEVVAIGPGGDWLLMTRLAGRHVDGSAPTATFNSRMARDGVLALYRMLFETGRVHADLHPGNVLVDGWRLGFIDFGLVVELDPQIRRAFRDFFLAFSSDDGSRCAHILIDTAVHVPARFAADRFEEQVSDIVSKHHGRDALNFEVVSFVKDIFEVQRRFGLVAGTDFCTAILSLLVFETVVKRIDPACDFQGIARVLLPSILGRQAPRRPWSDDIAVAAYPGRVRATTLIQQRL